MAHACPIEIGRALQVRLYEKIPGVVFTSATLATSGSFSYFKSSVGLNGDLSPKETNLGLPVRLFKTDFVLRSRVHSGT